MRSLSLKGGLLALSLGLLAIPVQLHAQEPADLPEAEFVEEGYALPSDLQDPSFDLYVNISLLQPAWVNRDAQLLTDLALQLAQGEKVLLRTHKAGSAKDLLTLALKIAQNGDDQAALSRVAQAATALKYEDLVALSKSTNKLAGASRKDDPALSVSVEKTNLDGFAAYSWMVDQLRSVELLGDKKGLEGFGDLIDSANGLTSEQKQFLKRRMSEIQAQPDDPAMKNNQFATTIGKLDGESRHNDAAQILNGIGNIIGAATGTPGYNQGYYQGGYNRGGYNQGGYNRGGYNQGGWNQGGHNHGGWNQGGYNRGGWNQGGYNQGGYNRGGWNQGGYNRGGWNQGGHNHGGHHH